jgi:tetratricopeptide (TPR) repeat protein
VVVSAAVGAAFADRVLARDVGADRAVDQYAAAAQPRGKVPPRSPESLPAVELTSDIMYKLMMAEVALQRGPPEIGVPALLDRARETKDPRIAQRATEVAWNARYTDAALEAAGIWLKAEPKNQRARQVLAAMLASQQKLDAARAQFEQWLAADPEHVPQSFLELSTMLSRNPDRKAVLELLRGLAKPYPKVPEARLAVAQAAWNAGNDQLALDESAAALKLKPELEIAALFHAQALQKRSNDEALAFLGDYLKTHPNAKDVRLNYARLLVTMKRYPEARKQFEALVEQFPQNGDVTMAVALLAIQAQDYEAAETQLKRSLEHGYGEPDVARVYLGQIAEERKRYDEALKWYSAVQPGEHYLGAQTRYAGVLSKQGKLAEARKHLQQIAEQHPDQRVALTQAEAQLLRDASQYKDAFDLLGAALAKSPNNPELLYEHAMAAEKIDRIDILEASLRKLIEVKPDNADAYNALGYTLADRNQRLPEARELIERALKLSPDNAYIIDSMGWVLFRLGQNQEALEHLKRAYTLRPDAEIAAHLGEVLWASGQQDEARKVWVQALKEHEKNEQLTSTVKRLDPAVLKTAQ